MAVSTTFKVVVSDPKTRKAYQKEVDHGTSGLIGRKIRDKVPGDFFGLKGYELEITGGSDREGFPMRRDVEGQGRKRLLLAGAPGFHPRIEGQRKRKSTRGNTISQEIIQVNAKIVKHGDKAPEELLDIKPKGKEEGKEEKPAE
ncbi:MAG: 30S ribosomal protein S6e [Candidatus Aenigmarchaeota archaeon]|nr:30S ribosomal protein S6e [Candidatus Aenigmarchaeota archaeon]